MPVTGEKELTFLFLGYETLTCKNGVLTNGGASLKPLYEVRPKVPYFYKFHVGCTACLMQSIYFHLSGPGMETDISLPFDGENWWISKCGRLQKEIGKFNVIPPTSQFWISINNIEYYFKDLIAVISLPESTKRYKVLLMADLETPFYSIEYNPRNIINSPVTVYSNYLTNTDVFRKPSSERSAKPIFEFLDVSKMSREEKEQIRFAAQVDAGFRDRFLAKVHQPNTMFYLRDQYKNGYFIHDFLDRKKPEATVTVSINGYLTGQFVLDGYSVETMEESIREIEKVITCQSDAGTFVRPEGKPLHLKIFCGEISQRI